MEKELWEIEIDIKTQKYDEAVKKGDAAAFKMKEGEKRLTEAFKNEGRLQTQIKLNELKSQEIYHKNKLARELIEFKTNSAKEIIEFKNKEAEKIRISKKTEADIKSQQKSDNRFTGQSTELGSINALTQQIAHYKTLSNTVKAGTTEHAQYMQKVKELSTEKKVLTGATTGLNTAVSGYMGTLIKAYGVQQAFNISLQSAKFHVMRDAFQGSEKDLEAFRKASANTVTDASLLALSNQASDLNINLRDQAILFSFAENQADKYNTSTEEGFIKVLAIMQGSTKGLKDLGITKSEFNKVTEELAKKQGMEVDENIRLQAIIKLTNTSYDEAINKSMDMADIHETVTVQVKNVADEHGNFWDVLSSLNPVVGFLNVGLEDMGKKEMQAAEDAKKLINMLDDYNSKIPGWGAATEELRNYFVDLANTFLVTAQTAQLIKDAMGGTESLRKGGDGSIPIQGINPNKKTRKSGSGTTTTKSGDPIDELLTGIANEVRYRELTRTLTVSFLEEQIKVIENENKANLKLEQKIKLLEAINQLRAKEPFGIKNIPDARSIDLSKKEGLPFGYTRMKHSEADALDIRPDMTSEDIQNILNQQMQAEKQKLENINLMYNTTVRMLDNFGLMEGKTGDIVNALTNFIQGLQGGGDGIFGILGQLFNIGLSIFTGGASSAIGSLGGGGRLVSTIGGSSGGGLRYGNNPPVITPGNSVQNTYITIKNPVTLGRGLEVETRKANVKSFVDG